MSVGELMPNVSVTNAMDALRDYSCANFFNEQPTVPSILTERNILCLGGGDSNLLTRIILKQFDLQHLQVGLSLLGMADSSDSITCKIDLNNLKIDTPINYDTDHDKNEIKVCQEKLGNSGLLAVLPSPFNANKKVILALGLTRDGTTNIMKVLTEPEEYLTDVNSPLALMLGINSENCKDIKIIPVQIN